MYNGCSNGKKNPYFVLWWWVKSEFVSQLYTISNMLPQHLPHTFTVSRVQCFYTVSLSWKTLQVVFTRVSCRSSCLGRSVVRVWWFVCCLAVASSCVCELFVQYQQTNKSVSAPCIDTLVARELFTWNVTEALETRRVCYFIFEGRKCREAAYFSFDSLFRRTFV